ncbi:Hsp20/alpha crystallin family protein [Cereibacter changlensis JA139]|uniref:Hsp20/alpha crystallin family protein n=1 Tax=Cereibacter changlensis JA139 TaxID=1188249 RepID=A0A2T4JPY7_9RHOB|nr:Hsp20/alpha crystallin family protein [Cereibacter changlensis JA139]
MKDLIPWARKDDAARQHHDHDGENPIAALQREMNQMLEGFWNRFGKSTGDPDWPSDPSGPKSDVVQTDNAVEVSIKLPGMTLDDIEVTVSGGMLTVKGEKKVERQEEKKGYYLSERSYGAIWRTIPLPPGVDGEKAEASYRNGLLTVRLPQTPEAQARVNHIEVKQG